MQPLFTPSELRVLIVVAMVCGVIAFLARRAADRKRESASGGPIRATVRSRFERGLPAEIALIASLGENAAPRETLGTVLLRTTPGVRLVSVVLTSALLYLIWVKAPGVWLPAGPATWALTAACLIASFGLFAYEARAERDRLTIRRWGLWRQTVLWRNLISLREDQHYEYILTFSPGGTVRLPKYLVGIHGLLTFAGEELRRNTDARVARG